MERAIGGILLDVDEAEGVARISLNRPQRRNALSHDMYQGILTAVEEVRENARVKCVMTMAAGGVAFCAGGDLFEMRERRRRPGRYEDRPALSTTVLHEALRSLPQTTMAVVEGYCVGGGMTLLAAHDLAIAATTAEFGLPEVLRGTQSANAIPVLGKHLPLKVLLFLALTGHTMDAYEALRAGLVSKVVPRDEIHDYAASLARQIASHHLGALQLGKRIAYETRDMTCQEGWAHGSRLAAGMGGLPDPVADVEGYLRRQKRPKA